MTSESKRKAIGKRLAEAREMAGFSTAVEAADATGIHVQSVRDQEAGRRGVDVEQLDLYARKYKVNFEWLATGRGEPRVEDNTIDYWKVRLNKDAYKEVVNFARFKAESGKDRA